MQCHVIYLDTEHWVLNEISTCEVNSYAYWYFLFYKAPVYDIS